MDKQKVIIITGPTAVGKTKIAIEIAKYYKTDLINGDAFQIYKYLNIATAKPTEIEQKMVKHHLIDFWDPRIPFSVADYQKLARDSINTLIKQGKVPIIVGGTGLYIDAVIRNYLFTDEKRQSIDDSKYQNESDEDLYNQLLILDKEAAIKIHPHNRKRVIRAIELAKNDSSIKHDQRNLKHELLYEPLIIFLNDDRDKLYDRINKRVDSMIDDGLLEEVKYLLDNNLLGPTAIQAIGYSQLIAYLNKNISLDEAINNIKQDTRHYAKRQITWFRHRDNVTNVLISEDIEDTILNIKKIIDNFLK